MQKKVMSQIRRVLLTAFATLALVVVANAQAPAPAVAGEWTVEAATPHGAITAGLVLKQEGTKLEGSITFAGTDPLPLAGELAGDKLSLETPADVNRSLGMRGTVSGNAIAGYISTDHGDIKFTATRTPRP